MNLTNGETHGLLVGPHASNLLSELILTRIDKTLFDEGYRFVRHIDDYLCYVDSESLGLFHSQSRVGTRLFWTINESEKDTNPKAAPCHKRGLGQRIKK